MSESFKEISLDLTGVADLQESMMKAVNLYSNKVEEALEESGKDFKRRVIQETRKAVNQKTGNLIKGYKLDPVSGYGINMEINFRGTAPHFHLIENGHELVTPKTRKGKKLKNGGKTVGFVAGRLIVHKIRSDYRIVFPQKMQKVCNEILKDSDLI